MPASSISNDTDSRAVNDADRHCASNSTGLSQSDWLCLSFLSSIGPARLSRLYTYLSQLHQHVTSDQDDNLSLFHHADTPKTISYDLLRALKWPDITARQAVDYLSHGTLTKEQATKRDESLAWLEEDDHHLLLREDEYYPLALREISVAPAFLYVEGNRDALALPKIGIVGARKCTRYGRETTFLLAEQLASCGICVVSGGALGIDTAAHQGALQSKTTPTIVVMGTGLLHRYPNQNRALFDDILERGGALISEYPLSTSPRPHLFPPRNRIISGLSMGVLVAEASLKSGSLISANYAVQQNREVFALPGRLTDLQSAGCHQLLRQGATLVRQVDDILAECPELPTTGKTSARPAGHQTTKKTAPDSRSHSTQNAPALTSGRSHSLPESTSDNAKAVVAIMEQEAQPMDFDALIRHSKMDAGLMMQVLIELELYGCVENREGLYGRC
ncbi:DNA-protecting protein DprA [Marinomonas sp. M1K-6]|uniref:DNA-protecting protein DprA n=1 Tax=Marinomonas profundi TaxID=2726122 RepID=A0A847R4Y9_9GAMM|nr:DNA-processing protein DprA [Marinomonas profundi]NLQ17106.1 DNA-protecting protein DprA [Marinomonas profundi]UDV04697.1 DNA-processing protein DprA [Marinomonas profundi]